MQQCAVTDDEQRKRAQVRGTPRADPPTVESRRGQTQGHSKPEPGAAAAARLVLRSSPGAVSVLEELIHRRLPFVVQCRSGSLQPPYVQSQKYKPLSESCVATALHFNLFTT